MHCEQLSIHCFKKPFAVSVWLAVLCAFPPNAQKYVSFKSWERQIQGCTFLMLYRSSLCLLESFSFCCRSWCQNGFAKAVTRMVSKKEQRSLKIVFKSLAWTYKFYTSRIDILWYPQNCQVLSLSSAWNMTSKSCSERIWGVVLCAIMTQSQNKWRQCRILSDLLN